MLTREEARAACDLAGSIDREGFERLIADYMPQGIFDELQQEIFDFDQQRHGHDDELAAHSAAMFAAGFHYGWILAERARGHR